jgi:hypothetical protein
VLISHCLYTRSPESTYTWSPCARALTRRYHPRYERVPAEADAPGAATGYWLKDALTGPDHAACLDGTAPLYYHEPGTGSGANKWYIHHEGGGWCYNLADCAGRAKGALGSTDPKKSKDGPTSNLGGGYFDADAKVNPQMHNWNKVFLRYVSGHQAGSIMIAPSGFSHFSLLPFALGCHIATYAMTLCCDRTARAQCDGGSFSGSNATSTDVAGATLWFRGKHVLKALQTDLLANRGLDKATDVVSSRDATSGEPGGPPSPLGLTIP